MREATIVVTCIINEREKGEIKEKKALTRGDPSHRN